MSPFAYRASDELAVALREYKGRMREHRVVVDGWNAANPDRVVVWLGGGGFSADRRPAGFRDGTDEVPAGLSRARSRSYLITARTKAGKPWREVLDRMRPPVLIETVFRRFGVPPSADGPATRDGDLYLAATRWLDGDDRGVFVANMYELGAGEFFGGGIGEHLTPVPLSEFYAAEEALVAGRGAAT